MGRYHYTDIRYSMTPRCCHNFLSMHYSSVLLFQLEWDRIAGVWYFKYFRELERLEAAAAWHAASWSGRLTIHDSSWINEWKQSTSTVAGYWQATYPLVLLRDWNQTLPSTIIITYYQPLSLKIVTLLTPIVADSLWTITKHPCQPWLLIMVTNHLPCLLATVKAN